MLDASTSMYIVQQTGEAVLTLKIRKCYKLAQMTPCSVNSVVGWFSGL